MDKNTIIVLFLGFLKACVDARTTESPGLPPSPSWIRCMNLPGNLNSQTSNTALNSLHWCQNKDVILPCLEEEIPKTASQYAIDYFISLSLTDGTLKQSSEHMCSKLPGVTDKLECAGIRSSPIMMGCSMIFNQYVEHVYTNKDQPGASIQSQKTLTCDATRETSSCMNMALLSCPLDTKSFLLDYYSLFSMPACVFNATLPEEIERVPDPVEESILMKCGAEASSMISTTTTPTVNAAVQSVTVTILLADCRLYRQRFQCFERELPEATIFLDVWQKQIFDLERALAANERFCSNANEFVSDLSGDCANSLDQSLQGCDEQYAATMGAAEAEFDNNPDSLIELETEACNASLKRVDCLEEAFQVCGETAAQFYAQSQLDMLPLTCIQRTNEVTPSTSPTTSTSTSTAAPTQANVIKTTQQPSPSPVTQLPNNPTTTVSPERTTKTGAAKTTETKPQTSNKIPAKAAVGTATGDNPNSTSLPTISLLLLFLYCLIPVL